MANVKNITEVPVAESSEGLNLIVNDGGVAKQIAASAVGAQADWNIEDTSNPAFILNKPAIAQSDWNIEDTSNPAFILNRPFFDTREFGTYSVTFDGDITGKEYNLLYSSDTNASYIVKISDETPSLYDLRSGFFTMNNNGTSISTPTINVAAMSRNGLTSIGDVLYLVKQDTTVGSFSFTAGLWAICSIADGVPVMYVSEISWTGTMSGMLQTMDSKYISQNWDLDLTVSNANSSIHSYLNDTFSFDEVKMKIANGIPLALKVSCSIFDTEIPHYYSSTVWYAYWPEGANGTNAEYIQFIIECPHLTKEVVVKIDSDGNIMEDA